MPFSSGFMQRKALWDLALHPYTKDTRMEQQPETQLEYTAHVHR